MTASFWHASNSINISTAGGSDMVIYSDIDLINQWHTWDIKSHVVIKCNSLSIDPPLQNLHKRSDLGITRLE